MYNNNNSSGGFKNFSSGPARGGSSFSRFGSPQRSVGGSSRSFGGPARPSFGGRSRFQATRMNPALFVKKAEAVVKIEEQNTIHTFVDFNLNPTLLANIKAKGFTKPTQIQDQAIIPIMEKKDVLGLAATGTGKTAAFALPLIDSILKNPRQQILIMAPTRELAMQIKQDIRSFTPGLPIYLALAIGGAFLREQIIDIRRGPHFIVGTPGRIKDLVNRRVIDLSRVNVLVLDEVDRMLDMGFITDIKELVDQIPKERQTLFFSATINNKIQALIGSFLRNPITIALKSANASTHVDQDIVRVPRHLKEQKLLEMMALPEFKKVLVFGATQRIVEQLSVSLTAKGFKAASLHGGKPQNKRTRIIRDYKESMFNILVATDVAARGLDIADITHVINYDQPNDYDDYTHRIGRTGRGDAMGFALTFIE